MYPPLQAHYPTSYGAVVVEHACLGPSRDSGLPVRGSPGAPGCHAFLCALPSSGA